MPYVAITEFDADWETHLKIDARINEAVGDGPIDGLILHAAGPCDVGTRVVDVWESKEHAGRFFTEQVGPALASLGVEPGPPVSMTEYDVELVRS